jgi:hypothetical protein
MSGSESALRAGDAVAAHKAATSSVLLNLLPHVVQTLRREPALGITICYLLVAMAGIFYNYSFYRQFGIPILSLSQIGDFLVAGIQRPMALLLVASTFPLCWLADTINAARRRSGARRREALLRDTPDSAWRKLRYFLLGSSPRWLTGTTYVALVVIYGWLFVGSYADHRAQMIKHGEAAQVMIWLNGDPNGLLPAKSRSWTYLGAVANYVFVYDTDAHRSVVLPVNNIARIEPVSDASGSARPTALAPIR